MTTTTQVSFFPKYSIDKQEKSSESKPSKSKSSKPSRKEALGDKSKSSDGTNVPRKSSKKDDNLTKRRPTERTKTPVISSVRSRLSDLRARVISRSMKGTPEPAPFKPEEIQSSFYYRSRSETSGSSQADLTLGKQVKVQAEVHSPSRNLPSPPEKPREGRRSRSSNSEGRRSTTPSGRGTEARSSPASDLRSSASPQPLIETDRKYSFILIRDKCRQMINLSPISTNL